jgi:hypothetical protein
VQQHAGAELHGDDAVVDPVALAALSNETERARRESAGHVCVLVPRGCCRTEDARTAEQSIADVRGACTKSTPKRRARRPRLLPSLLAWDW